MRPRFVLWLSLPCCLALGMSELVAQTAPTGDEDPTAKTGALKSQIETGGSYDAHSGNATRAIPDLRVPGALGSYGLNFVRYYNSLRSDRIQNLFLNPAPEPNQPTDFGAPGWSHSWRWSADYEEYLQEPPVDGGEYIYHTLITITFPDGRASKYKIVRYSHWHGSLSPDPRFGPPYYAHRNETNWPGGKHDHLGDMAQDGSSFWLYREDGGSVHFTGGPWGYLATEVYDPNGFKTLLHYDAGWQLYRVEQEGGGRSLNLTWEGGRIKRVQSGGPPGVQSVEYHYSNGLLTSVTYENDPVPGLTATAQYTYLTIPPPTGFINAGPLLATADDPRFEGAMTKIAYAYQETGCRPQGQPWPPPYPNGQFDYYYSSPTAIKEEKNPETGEVVSRFGIGCFDGTRMEYNGLGGFRKFFFGRSAQGPGTYSIQGYQLAKLTDFTNVYPLPANLPFEWQNYYQGHPRQIWDARNILTETVYGDGSGQPVEIRHAGSDGSVYRYDRTNPGNSLPRDTTRIRNPYNRWLFSKTDERNQTTTYTRDERRRVTRIDYPGGSWEQFTYNGWNQVTAHTLASGAVKTYEYDGRGRLIREYNSVDRTLEGTNGDVEYTYDDFDRVRTKKDGRARINGKHFSTQMSYNGRHQITRVEYAGIIGATNNPSVWYGYDTYGNCTSISSELATYPGDPYHTKRYEYDSYRRCTAYVEPLWAPTWNGGPTVISRRWDWLYDRWMDGLGPRPASAHTRNEWRIEIGPVFNEAGERKMTARAHDLENRIVVEQSGWIQRPTTIGDWYLSEDGETHYFSYDENGQKKSYTDPRGRVTTYDYDSRNRLWKTNETVNTVPRTTETLYDTTGNKILVKFPVEAGGQRTQQWLDYDAFGQPGRFIDERNNTINMVYWWGPMKKLRTVTTHRQKDGGGMEDQVTTFMNDALGRQLQILFPDGSYENSAYEFGQLKTFRNRKGQTKQLSYDARGREDFHSWIGAAAPSVSRVWDAASRMTSISNSFSSIDFRYDNAGQLWWEGNNIAGSGGRRQTTFYRYPDGNLAQMQYPNGAWIRHDYTARGQLKEIFDYAGWKRIMWYAYHPDGKVAVQVYANSTTSWFDYDGRGFMQSVEHRRGWDGPALARRDYMRDERDRITVAQKGNNQVENPVENGRGDVYRYDAEGQLTEAYYECANPAGNFSGWRGGDVQYFGYDALGNRQAFTYSGTYGPVDYVRRDNGLNQYSSWSPSIIYHDDNYPGWELAGNGVLMADGWITASYNALNQPVAIWSPAYNGTSNFMWFGYDPLGRCVKRWIGPSSAASSNPATYLYYDGWNLIQEGPSASSASRLYFHGGRVDEIVASLNVGTGQYAYHHYDVRGDCLMLTDASGNIMEQYFYNAFGSPRFLGSSGNSLATSPFGNRFLFTGREWLQDLKLYDFRHRLYHPELGRFMQPDPKHFEAGDYNLYRYCQNDPVNKTDPFGLEFFPGEFVEVDSIPGMFGRTLSSPHITFKVVPAEGGFRPQVKVDVTVHRKEIAKHAQGRLRSERAKDATREHENKHEAQQKQWHDKNQDSSPKGPFPNKDAAEKAGSDKANALRKDFYNNVKQNDRHQPDKEWKGILDREKRS